MNQGDQSARRSFWEEGSKEMGAEREEKEEALADWKLCLPVVML